MELFKIKFFQVKDRFDKGLINCANKYTKNKFYPLITDTILNTVETLNGKDVLVIKDGKMTWKELYDSSEFRWRKTLKESSFDFERLRLFTSRSGIKVIKNYNKTKYY